MSLPERILVLVVLLSAGFFFSGSALATADRERVNSCVDCHSGLPSSSFPGVKSHSWAGSVHQKHGVTCDKCHGGDPEVVEKKEAHAGVFNSRDPQSSVYFKNIPSTCGACHGVEYYKFKQSQHYRMLETSGRGPECVTCHGSMVTRILSPDNLASVCEQCHNERMDIRPYIPQKAKAVLLLLRESQELLDAIVKLHPVDAGTMEAERMSAAQTSLHSAKLEWHKFDLDAIIDYLQEMYDSLKIFRKP